MLNKFLKRFYMPYLTGPGCVLDALCGETTDFPTAAAACNCTTAAGGINELYFIPCTETFTQANVTSVAWWQAMITAETLGRSGLGLGSIGKKSQRSDRVASCRTEQITGITWALRYGIKCFDKTSARSTAAKLNALILRGDKFLLVARMCDGDEEILPIGKFDASDFDWTVPDNSDENQIAQIELSWKELGIPTPVTVPGLAAILPKLI